MGMSRKKAIKYLVKKGKIEDTDVISKEDEKEVEKVMTSGKIYGEPVMAIKF